ncbi:uroporphyrinogen-III C-methyltransferase [Lentilactobacillus raoultii]|uniref:uroporphyrinogen-III C-methyltransferase n=1 Tax=Lentilactobacillus raoultii TaxID=1987503 RepID=A0ABW3PIT7_9LACO|nr:uroporphyrinogen-III C-methyltransferase [Lentilactobacillus raoultii]
MARNEGVMLNGFVSLVGAGPGNPELLTVLGKRRLEEADVVVYDRLVNPAILSAIQAEKIDVGKLPHHHKVSQFQINQLLTNLAREGKRVVRLKAGDPYVFGRGGEEGSYLKKHHVAFEVVPGITSAIAGLSAAGIPITDRNLASSFHVITGHRKVEGKSLNWDNIAHQEGTLVFLMGMEELAQITAELITHGKTPKTPVAIIQWATHWNQRSVKADLAHINDVVRKYGIGSPALIVVGKVVDLMPELVSNLPLQGMHLLIPFKRSSKLFEKLQDDGASVNFFKRRKVHSMKFDLPNLELPGTLLITSMVVFNLFMTKLLSRGYDYRNLREWHLIAMNHAIERKMKSSGIIADGVYDKNNIYPQPAIALGVQDTQDFIKLTNNQFSFLAVGKKQSLHQSVDFKTFHAIIIPSTSALQDLVIGCDKDQFVLLKQAKIVAMGKLVKNACQQLGLENVSEVQPSVRAVLSSVRRVKNEINCHFSS